MSEHEQTPRSYADEPHESQLQPQLEPANETLPEVDIRHIFEPVPNVSFYKPGYIGGTVLDLEYTPATPANPAKLSFDILQGQTTPHYRLFVDQGLDPDQDLDTAEIPLGGKTAQFHFRYACDIPNSQLALQMVFADFDTDLSQDSPEAAAMHALEEAIICGFIPSAEASFLKGKIQPDFEVSITIYANRSKNGSGPRARAYKLLYADLYKNGQLNIDTVHKIMKKLAS